MLLDRLLILKFSFMSPEDYNELMGVTEVNGSTIFLELLGGDSGSELANFRFRPLAHCVPQET